MASAFARLAFIRISRQRLSASSSSSISNNGGLLLLSLEQTQDRLHQLRPGLLCNTFSSSSDGTYANQDKSPPEVKSEGPSSGKDNEVAVQAGKGRDRKNWRSLFPAWRRHPKRSTSLWGGDDHTLYHDELAVPSINIMRDMLQRSVANDFLEAIENVTMLFDNLSSTRLIPRMTEKDECYKLRFMVPGLRKADIKITVHDGALRMTGQRKKEAADEGGEAGGKDSDEDDHPGMISYYEASLLVPEDAKVDGIKAELRDGVLTIVMPKDEEKKKAAIEIKIQ